jgi:ribosomal protein S7
LKFFLTRKNNKDEKKMHKKLIDELLFATKNTGASINKKKNLYEYAFVKKKYFYYRWF